MRDQILARGPGIRRAILLGLVVGIPVLFLRMMNDPFNVPKLALLIGGVTVVVIIRAIEILQGASPTGLERLAFPALAMVVPLVLAAILSPYRGWTLFGLYGRFQGLVPYLFVILLGILIADAFRGDPTPVAWAVLWAGGIVGAYALVQFLGMDPFEWSLGGKSSDASLSTLGNPNFAGGFLSIALPVAVGLWGAEPRQRRRVIQLGVPMIGGLIVAFSQGGWAAGLAGVSITGGLLLAQRWRAAPAVGVGMAALLLAAAIGVGLLGAIDPDNALVEPTMAARGRWWITATRMGVDHPVFGRGPNVYASEGVQYRTVEDAIVHNYDFGNDPHSVFLAFFANAGIPGALGYLLVLGWAVRTALNARGEESDPRRQALQAAFIGAIGAYAVQSLASIDELSLRSALWIALGGLAAATASAPPTAATTSKRGKANAARKRRQTRARPLQAAPAVGVLALLGLAATWWAGNMLVADARVQNAKKLFASGDSAGGRREFDLALGFRDDYDIRRQYGVELGQAAATAPVFDPQMVADMAAAYSYLDSFPDVPALAQYANDLVRIPDRPPELSEKALSLYRRALLLDPLNPVIAISASDLMVELGSYEEARDLLVGYDGRVGLGYPDYFGALARAKALTGDFEGAQAALAIVLPLDPQEPRALQAQEIISGST